MHLGQKLVLPIRLVLACAIFLGAAQVQPSTIACTLTLCGTKCPMHAAAKAEPEPTSCCAKKKQKPAAKPKSCKCSIKANDAPAAAMARAIEFVPVQPAVIADVPLLVEHGFAIEEASIAVPRCHGPPGKRDEAPDLGRAPPVL